MIKTVNDQSIDRVALRQQGWKWFAVVLGLQMLIIITAYILA
ncbi:MULTISPECIES: KGW motif small protein [Acinetobacter]|nr:MULTISPECIES: KGW motif small protein [Acinetobacter]